MESPERGHTVWTIESHFRFGSLRETFVYQWFSQRDYASFLIVAVPLGAVAHSPVPFWFALGLPLEF